MVTHEQIEENLILDRYLMGRLSQAERAEFEDHFMACETCLEAIELATAFRRDLKREAVRDIEKTIAVTWVARLTSARMMRLTTALLAVALVVAVSLPGVVDTGRLETVRVATLEVVRSDDPFSVNRIRLPDGMSLVLMDQFVDETFPTLRVTLTGVEGAVLHRESLEGMRETIDLSLGQLDAGRYRLTIEGEHPERARELIGEYGFEILTP